MTRTGRPATDRDYLPRLSEREDRAVDAIRAHRCDLCGRALLIAEIGPHYRAEHPERSAIRSSARIVR